MKTPKAGPACVIVLMGVSGSGKTMVGKLLADQLGWPFYDGDDFQPKDNVAKMSQGVPLNDRDRRPWLLALHNLLVGLTAKRSCAVLACSALKQDYRDLLVSGMDGIKWVYLKCDYRILEARLKNRKGHFFKAAMLDSQFEILEEPEDALTVHVDCPPDSIVARIRKELGV
ncbi:MAG: carbohydrate kinase, thermoresistant glucokinase family [Fibrobacteres bacterium]|nr:carbohydrate kinase, thermoresistant glucokinase family [Fibrobacterota bacterium]